MLPRRNAQSSLRPLQPNHEFFPRQLSLPDELHALLNLIEAALHHAQRMMGEASIFDELSRDAPQILAELPLFLTAGTPIGGGPGGSLAKDGRPQGPVGRDHLTRGRVFRERVQGDVVAPRAADGCEAERGGLDVGDTVEGIAEIVLGVGTLKECQ